MAVDVGVVRGGVEVDCRVVGGFGVASAPERWSWQEASRGASRGASCGGRAVGSEVACELRKRVTWTRLETAPRPAPDRPSMRATQRRLVAYMVEGVSIAASCVGKLLRAVNGLV